MSYDIELKDPVTGKTIEFDSPHQCKGGTRAIGGTAEAWLNVTYNYGRFYREVNKDGIRAIYGLSGAESILVLEEMIEGIEANHPDKETSDDYWEPLPGNALKPLYQLLSFAKMRPDGVWEGD